MSVLAGITSLCFEPKMGVLLDAIAVTGTPENLRPRMGPLANLTYKPANWRYMVRLSAAPTSGSVTIRLLAGETVIQTKTQAISGLTEISDRRPVDLSAVAGEAELRVELDVTVAANAGITATLDSYVDVEQPLTITGC